MLKLVDFCGPLRCNLGQFGADNVCFGLIVAHNCRVRAEPLDVVVVAAAASLTV